MRPKPAAQGPKQSPLRQEICLPLTDCLLNTWFLHRAKRVRRVLSHHAATLRADSGDPTAPHAEAATGGGGRPPLSRAAVTQPRAASKPCTDAHQSAGRRGGGAGWGGASAVPLQQCI